MCYTCAVGDYLVFNLGNGNYFVRPLKRSKCQHYYIKNTSKVCKSKEHSSKELALIDWLTEANNVIRNSGI